MSQIGYWQEVAQAYQPFATKTDRSHSTFGQLSIYNIELDAAPTKALLQSVNQAYHTEINDILLAALAQTINGWSKQQQIVIGLESHGREALFSDLDINNTVGWFTNLYPVALQTEPAITPGDLIKSIKEQLRAIPQNGIGYGLLRYLHPDEAIRTRLASTRWDLMFNYLGQLDSMFSGSTWFGDAQESKGQSISEQYELQESLILNAYVAEGRLIISWNYATDKYEATTIQTLAEQYLTNLRQLIQHCLEGQTLSNTPSDLGLGKELSYQELDSIYEYLGEQEADGDEILKF